MSSRKTTISQTAWISIVLHLFVALLLISLFSTFVNTGKHAVLFGAITYLILSYSLRTFLTKDQKKGCACVKKNEFLDAIAHFEASYTFFNRYKWLDKYRYITLLSSSRISYREMALCNIAFCYVQGGNHAKGKQYYMRALLEYPESYLAQSALKFFVEEKDNN